MPIRKRKRRAKRKTKAKATGIREESLDFSVSSKKKGYVGFTYLQSRKIDRMRRLAKKVGLKFSIKTLGKSKKAFGWRKTWTNMEKTIRYHAGLAYTAYVDSLKDWMKDWGGDVKMPKTFATLNNPANRNSFTFASLQECHDIMYDVKNQIASPQYGDTKAHQVLMDGLKIGKEINDIVRYKKPSSKTKAGREALSKLKSVNPVKQTHRQFAIGGKEFKKVYDKRGKRIYQRKATKPDR